MGSVTAKVVACDFHLSEGQCSDFTGADVVRKDLPACGHGDRGSRG